MNGNTSRLVRQAKWLQILTAGLFLFVGCSRRPSVSATSGMETSEDRWMRVLLFDNLSECTISSYGGLTVEDLQTASRVRFGPPFKTLRISRNPDGFSIEDYRFSAELMIHTEMPFVFEFNEMAFRGHLRLVPNDEGSGFLAVNYVPLESYLCGVVPAEMHPYWEPEALKAQAVACRTYSLFIKYRFGSRRAWDVKRTQSNQVYRGVVAETPTTNRAVLETTGQVLVCPDAQGQWRLFPTYYSSVCGGHTENSRNVFGDTVKALEGVDCPYCRQTARTDFYFWSGVFLDRKVLTKQLVRRYPLLARLGNIQQIEPERLSEHGRVLSVRLTGSTGLVAFLRGEDFRLAVDSTGRKIKSTFFTVRNAADGFEFVDGRGFGHGVGLCQSGAQSLARQRKTYREILEYYYPGSRIVRLSKTE